MKSEQKRRLSRKIIVSVYRGGGRLFSQSFEHGPIIFGRQPSCDVVLDFSFISRTHCQVVEENERFFLVDLNSRNGIFVEDKQIEKYPLNESVRFSLEELNIEIKVLGLEEHKKNSQDERSARSVSARTKTLSSSEKPARAPKIPSVNISAPQISAPLKELRPVQFMADHEATIIDSHHHQPRQQSHAHHDAGGILGHLAYSDLVELHPQSHQGGLRRVEAVVMWHDQVTEVHEFEPNEVITIGSSPMAAIKIPTLSRGWKLARVDFDSTACYVPKGPTLSLKKADGSQAGTQELLETKAAKLKGSGYQFNFGTREVVELDLGTDIKVFLRYIPAPPIITTRKAVEPDTAIKQALIGSSVLHLVLAVLLIVNAPVPKNVPKLKNVPERYARLLVEPVPPAPTPTPPPPEPPKKEVAKKEPVKLPKVEKPREVVKKMELPKQLAKENKWPIVVKKPVQNTPAAKINNPKPGPEPKVQAKVTEGPPAKAPPAVKVESMGALAALGGLSDGPASNLPPTNIKIEKNAAPGAIGSATSTASFGEGVPVANGRLAGGGGGGGGAVRTKGNGSGTGVGYGTAGLTGAAGTRGVAGAIVGQPKLAGSSGKTEGLTRDQVMKVMQKYLGEVQHCYEKSLLSSPDLQGRMEFEWDIEASGKVSSVRIKKSSVSGGDELGECIKGVFMSIKFPSATNGQSTTPTIGFPFGRM